MFTTFQALGRRVRRALEFPLDLRVIMVAHAYQIAAEARGLDPMRRDGRGDADCCPDCRKVTIHTIWEDDAYVCYFCLLRRDGPIHRHALGMLEDGRHLAFLYRTMLEIRSDDAKKAVFLAVQERKAKLSGFMAGHPVAPVEILALAS